jgi:hypothetical protein
VVTVIIWYLYIFIKLFWWNICDFYPFGMKNHIFYV